MKAARQFLLLLRVTHSYAIARRYFVVNGFDGALTMLGIIAGFYISKDTHMPVIISACLGAAVALGMSGFSSAYVSEAAERRRELRTLEAAMVTDLADSAHGLAARLIPAVIALVNGMAPLSAALIIITPLWFSSSMTGMPDQPLQVSIAVAFVIIFLLGVFLGKVSGTFWLFSGLRTLLVGFATYAIIFMLTPG